ncbi:PREDICTED: uncharacterized protein LOC107357781 isoform X2 [Acropora digitifera]|uniref:uncharacterized protein LOC107357781 isoform X2 n=1 Tax=Acropora digitifera TaxID=70779 RepID=UPI00077AB677|nr:PREDICTED: uncharacterized protein LOC107357781 isoform X2 [Acropora digitifera]
MTDALVQTYGKHQYILQSKFSTSVTNEKKKQAWIKVATAVNAVNPAERKTVEQIKKKWEDITGHVKKKERQARRQELKKINTTGNGFLADEDDPDSVATCSEILNQSEQEVARILGPEILSGIPGGQDSMILDNTALPKPVSEQDLNQGSNNSPCDDICDVLQDNLKAQLGKKRTKTLSEAQLDVRQFNFIFAVHLIGKCEFSDISGSVILCSRK